MDRALLVGGVAGAGVLLFLLTREGTPERVARGELARWHGLTEHDPAAAPILAEYWESAGQPFLNPDVPWSAAFISHTVRASSTPDALAPSGAHIYYARQAYLDRGVPGRYGAYRPEEVSIEPGDIVLRGRAGDPLSFSDLQSSGPMIKTHGDIVTAVGPESATAVGGNMGGRGISSVKERLIPHAGGVVTDPAVVAVLRYQEQAQAGLGTASTVAAGGGLALAGWLAWKRWG